MSDDLCMLTVHAHPDDEASKGACTLAKYGAEGVRTVLVCCTGGEEGDILNPAMDRPEIRENLAQVRRDELAKAADVIGFDEVVMLGYRDSGMAETDANGHADCFAAADLDEAVGRLVAIIRRERPQVIITYGDDQQGYPHPDHLMVHDITIPAFEQAGDPDKYPELGEPFTPLKLYYSTWSQARILKMHEKFLELGLESPFEERWLDRPSQDHKITSTIDVADHADVRYDALLAHATQVDPESKFWFGLPREVARAVHPYDDFELARSLVDTETPETDLFAGIREPAETP